MLARDRKASAEFVRLYSHLVYRFVVKRLAPRLEAADDLTQDIMLAAWSSLKSYSGGASLSSWILGVARFKVQDYYRAKLREALVSGEDEHSDDAPDPSPGGLEMLSQAENASRAASVLGQMREDYALLLRWRYWDAQSARTMAKETGRSEKSVERMLQRARVEFRKLWVEQEGGSR